MPNCKHLLAVFNPERFKYALNRAECVLGQRGSSSEWIVFAELGCLCRVHLYSGIFLSIPFHFSDVTHNPVTYQASPLLQNISVDQRALAVHVLFRSDFKCHTPACDTGLPACSVDIQKSFEPSHRCCSYHCPGKCNFTLYVHGHAIYLKKTFISTWTGHKGLGLIFCFISVFIFTCKPTVLLHIKPVTWENISKQRQDFFYLIDTGNNVPALAIGSVSTMTEMSFCGYLSLPAFLSTLESHFWGLWVEFISPYSRCWKPREILRASYPLVVWGER